ncbi:MAG: FHA domain-containing protein [Pseudomonadota bacterium]
MAEGQGALGSFLRELRRRKVTRTCILYILVCWGVLQVGDILYDALGWDEAVASRNFLYIAVLGFPVCFAIAWFFQITSEGIVRTTSFVERRVLNNIPPINDRRRSVGGYFRNTKRAEDYRWVISVESGPLAGLSFGIDQDIIIGRAIECDLAMLSPHISRQHAKLTLEENNKLFVEDLGSSNGTNLNGRSLETRSAVRDKDELRFHDIVFKIAENYTGPDRELETMNKTTFIRAVDVEGSAEDDSKS